MMVVGGDLGQREGRRFLAGIVLIFSFSSVPQNTLAALNPGLAAGWGHCLEFGLLGVLWFRWCSARGVWGWGGAGHGILFAALVALADESYQSLIPGRMSEGIDGVVDLTGFTLSLAVMALLRHRWGGSRPRVPAGEEKP